MLIELENVAKKYNESKLNLQDINFELNEAEAIALLGQNGCGKSTILKMINGLIPCDKGEIRYKGRALKTMDARSLRSTRKEIAYIFQHANLLENKSVYYHLSLIYKLNKTNPNQDEIQKIMKFMSIEKLRNSFCGTLSGGEKQKVAIAMALLQEPKVLLCDEISSALDKNSEEEIFNLLLNIKNTRKIALVIVSHNLALIKKTCDKVYLINNNRIEDVIIPNNKNKENKVSKYTDFVKDYLEQ